MIQNLIDVKKNIPDSYIPSILDIDFNTLYEQGIKLILTDLDNTLVSYKVLDPTQEVIEFVKKAKSYGIEVVIVSNSGKKRVKRFSDGIPVPYFHTCLKPFTFKLRKAKRKFGKKLKPSQVLVLGDQLMTDVYSAKKCHFLVVLVHAIDRKTEKWTTRCNRRMEIKVLKKIEKKYSDLYLQRLKKYKEEHYGEN